MYVYIYIYAHFIIDTNDIVVVFDTVAVSSLWVSICGLCDHRLEAFNKLKLHFWYHQRDMMGSHVQRFPKVTTVF